MYCKGRTAVVSRDLNFPSFSPRRLVVKAGALSFFRHCLDVSGAKAMLGCVAGVSGSVYSAHSGYSLVGKLQLSFNE